LKKKRKKDKLTDEPAFTVRLTEASDDWIRAARLQKLADAGDKEAAKELKRMEAETLVPVEDLQDGGSVFEKKT
jgi:hypothetical protein